MEKVSKKYFLAANSCEGFVSLFKKSYSAENGWKAYIIKGGPGTGKSSFMKYMTAKAEEKGVTTELCPCSSDPDSLDAVIFPELKTVIMDGTAPHIVDPDYPAVCETILNFGEFWNKEKFSGKSNEIIAVTNQNKALHKTASGYIKAFGNLIENNLKIASYSTNRHKTEVFAEKLCKKYIPKGKGNSFEWERFLSGITPKGVVFHGNNIVKHCDKTVIIEDEFGSVSNIIMRKIRNYALNEGYEIITVKNAFLPSVLTDHIIIPQLSLCFLRESRYGHFTADTRRIHAKRFMNLKTLQKNRERIKFNNKAARQLLTSACTVLNEAKSVHDKIEKYYISAMDFNALTSFAESFSNELF